MWIYVRKGRQIHYDDGHINRKFDNFIKLRKLKEEGSVRYPMNKVPLGFYTQLPPPQENLFLEMATYPPPLSFSSDFLA